MALFDDPNHPDVWYWDESGQWFGKGHLSSKDFHERAMEYDGNLDDPDLFCKVEHVWATNEEDGRFDYSTFRSEEFPNPLTLGCFPSFHSE